MASSVPPRSGVHGDADWTADSARAKAKEIRAAVAAGGDPAGDKYADRKAETMEQLCARYEAATKAGRADSERIRQEGLDAQI